MANSNRRIGTATAALALLLAAGAANAAKPNRSVESVHQPIVNRTDYVLDVGAGPHGLAYGETERLAGWFDGLGLGYGDTIMLDDPAGMRSGTRDVIAAVASRYGMLLAHTPPPITAGRPAPGTVRVVVSRSVAHVEGCSDWSHSNAEYVSGSASNFGCSTAGNLAAMIANPEDLVVGQRAGNAGDPLVVAKAIKTFRDATPTGSGALKSESTGGK